MSNHYMSGEQKKFIEVKQIIRQKSPKLAKWIPSFLVSYLQKTIHEDEVNDIMYRLRHLRGLDFVDALIQDLNVEVILEGQENIPLGESVIFASNHPLGGLDGIAFMHAIGRYRRDVKFLVNDILLNISNLEPLFVGVNKIGGQSKSAIAAIEEAYADDHALLVFPAGLVSRKTHGQVMDLEWKKSFISKAKKYKKNIVPVYIDGKNSNFFYNLANWRNRFGVKFNIEMLYLADEFFKQRNQRVTIKIGKEISYSYFDSSKNEKQWAAEVKKIVYTMK